MPSSNAVWGIDIGQCGLKAIKLQAAGNDRVEAVAFDVIEHPKILSQPDADRDELISSALEKFASRNDISGDQFVVGVPGQQTFARFCKMPPIDLKKDAKKIPELVRYEASQQIPFDMDDVVWDYQVFTSEGSPDIEVGIFAIRKDLIRKHLSFFSEVGISPISVQTVPAALYNFCHFDGRAPEEGKATVLIDVGAQNTDLIIVEPNAAWTRNIPLGGNSFTEALVRAFKLSFAKAESLKRTAATSKYARQIFQAMRPVFADLVAEIQRSIGFYGSTHRDVELAKVLALGNAFMLPGLQKYLENNLTVGGGVQKLEKFNRITASEVTNAPQFTENMLTFAAAYGLAVQGLGLAKIRASLLPTELARVAAWKKKRPYFIATAASLALAASVPLAANVVDQGKLESQTAAESVQKAESIIRQVNSWASEYQTNKQNTGQRDEEIKTLLNLRKDKLVMPRVVSLVYDALPPLNPPDLMNVRSVDELKELIAENPAKYARTARNQLIIEKFDVRYVPDVTKEKLGNETASSATPAAGAGGAMGAGAPGGFGRGGPGGFSRGAPGGARGRMGPGGGGGAPQPSASENQPPGENAGFVVTLQARLLHGTRQSEADEWLNGEYFENLRTLSHTPDWGFFIPKSEDREDPSLTIVALRAYQQSDTNNNYGGAGGRFGGGAPGGGRFGGGAPGGTRFGGGGGGTDTGTTSDVKYPDPVTGEETRNDWYVEIAFKLKMGEPPAEASAEDENTGRSAAPGGN